MRRIMLVAVLFVVVAGVVAQDKTPDTQEKVAAFKQAVQQNKSQLKRYEWIETTTVTIKGEVKSQKQSRCYYGVDGNVQKVEISATPESQPSGGRLKRRIVAKKKGEMTDYMKKAVDLIHKYVPPDPAMIQNAKDNNKVTVGAMQPNNVIQLSLNDILLDGDLMSATLDIKKNAIVEIRVSSYLDSRQDSVLLNVAFSRLPDGTSYASQTTLDAKAKNIKVTVENTGHHAMN
jgi:hypothetical protein